MSWNTEPGSEFALSFEDPLFALPSAQTSSSPNLESIATGSKKLQPPPFAPVNEKDDALTDVRGQHALDSIIKKQATQPAPNEFSSSIGVRMPRTEYVNRGAASVPAGKDSRGDIQFPATLPSSGMNQSQNGQQNDSYASRPLARVDDNLPASSRDDLAKLLEGLARALRSNPEGLVQFEQKDRGADVAQLKELLLQAQETIISLLNDRVFDRAKIAKLEAEARVLPDMQAQATRAMGLAMRSEDVQRELSQVKTEVERLRTSYVRQEQKTRGFIGWLFGKS